MTLRVVAPEGIAQSDGSSLAEAIEQFAARCAAVAPGCVLMALQCGDEAPEIFAYPAAKAVKLGLMQEMQDVLDPSPFVEGEE